MANTITKKGKAEFAASLETEFSGKSQVNNQAVINAAVEFARKENPDLAGTQNREANQKLHRIADQFLSSQFGAKAQIDVLSQNRNAEFEPLAASSKDADSGYSYKVAVQELLKDWHAAPQNHSTLSRERAEIRLTKYDSTAAEASKASESQNLKANYLLDEVLKGAVLKASDWSSTAADVRKAICPNRDMSDEEGLKKDIIDFQNKNNLSPADGNIRADIVLKLIEQNKFTYGKYGSLPVQEATTNQHMYAIGAVLNHDYMHMSRYSAKEVYYTSDITRQTLSFVRQGLGLEDKPIFDGQLEAALIDFQVKNKLPITGSIDPDTIKKLTGLTATEIKFEQVLSGDANLRPEVLDASNVRFTVMKAINPERSIKDISGFRQDLIEFQKSLGINSNAGVISQEVILGLIASNKLTIYSQKLIPTEQGHTVSQSDTTLDKLMSGSGLPISRTSDKTTFLNSETGKAVIEVRRALGLKPEPIFDTELETAVLKYQIENKITLTGCINYETCQSLYSKGKLDCFYNEYLNKWNSGLLLEENKSVDIRSATNRKLIWNALFDEDRSKRAANLELGLAKSPHYDSFLANVLTDAKASRDVNKQVLCQSLIEARKVGIDLPMRLARTVEIEELKKIIQMKKSPDWSKPLAIISYPFADHNGALSEINGTLLSDLIASGYNIQYCDAHDQTDLNKNLEVSSNKGNKKSDLLIIGGHGSSSSLTLDIPWQSRIHTKSTEDLNLARYIKPGGTLLLHSCSTADHNDTSDEALAYKISRELPGVTIVAYNRPSNSFCYLKDNNWFSRLKTGSNTVDITLPGQKKVLRVEPRNNEPSLSVLRNGKFMYGDSPLAKNDPQRKVITEGSAY